MSVVSMRASPSTPPQYVVPADLLLQPVAGSSNHSQTIWDSLDLSQGFPVTVPGSQKLTPEATTFVNRMFDVSQCAAGSHSPSPIQSLSSPHPQTPEHLTEENISQLSSLTSRLMVTPTGSPHQLEMMEGGDREVLAHFGIASTDPSINGMRYAMSP